MNDSPLKKIKLKHSEDYFIKVLLKETKLKDIMSDKLVTIAVNAPFREVPKKFSTYGIRHLPVVNRQNQLVGLITQRDLFKIQPPKKLIEGQWYYDDDALNDVILDNVMIKDVFSMGLEDSMGEALVKMVRNKYGCILVVDPQKVLKGIITQFDILSVAAQIFLE